MEVRKRKKKSPRNPKSNEKDCEKTLPNKRIKFEGGHSSTSNNLGALRMLPVPLPLPPLERVPEPKQTAEKPAKPKLKPKKRKNKKATTKPQKKKEKD